MDAQEHQDGHRADQGRAEQRSDFATEYARAYWPGRAAKPRDDSGCAAASTVVRRRWRRCAVNARCWCALHYAMERGELGSHPLARVRWRVPKPSVAVDPGVVANPNQARDLLAAVSYVGSIAGRRLVGLFACMYCAEGCQADCAEELSTGARTGSALSKAWGKATARCWKERIFGFRTKPSRISMAFPTVGSASHAAGPLMTLRRWGRSASLISHVAEFHRWDGLWSTP